MNARKRRLLAALGTTLVTVISFVDCVGDDPNDVPNADAGTDSAAVDSGVAVDATPAADTAPPLEASVDAGACDLSKPFGDPTLVSGVVNTTSLDDGFWLLPDGLTAYISTQRPDAGADIGVFSVKRTTVDAPWANLVAEPAVNGAGQARQPILTADGKTLYFQRGGGGAAQEVWTATRASTQVVFGTPSVASAPLNVPASTNLATWVSPDGKVLWLSSSRPGSAATDVYRTVLGSGGFGVPEAVPSLNSASDDAARVTPDELQAFVTSSRTGGKGGNDLYYARRTSTQVGFPPPVPIDSVNTPAVENALFVSDDGCALYFSRTPGPLGNYDVLVARRGR